MAKGLGPLFLLGGAGAIALMASKKKPAALGVDVSDGCADVKIVDMPSFEVHMFDIYTQQRNQGNQDPFDIANAIVKSVSNQCRVFPEDMRSAGEFNLYSIAVKFSTLELSNEIGLSEIMKNPRIGEYGEWIETQRQRLMGFIPDPTAVMFIQDGDSIQVGSRWMDEVFYPTMQDVEKNTPLLFTPGTAVTVAGIVVKNTIFINEDGEMIEVDLKQSPAGKEFLNSVTQMVKEYIENR